MWLYYHFIIYNIINTIQLMGKGNKMSSENFSSSKKSYGGRSSSQSRGGSYGPKKFDSNKRFGSSNSFSGNRGGSRWSGGRTSGSSRPFDASRPRNSSDGERSSSSEGFKRDFRSFDRPRGNNFGGRPNYSSQRRFEPRSNGEAGATGDSAPSTGFVRREGSSSYPRRDGGFSNNRSSGGFGSSDRGSRNFDRPRGNKPPWDRQRREFKPRDESSNVENASNAGQNPESGSFNREGRSENRSFNRDRGPRNFDRGPRNFDRGSRSFDRGPRGDDRGPRNFDRGPRNSDRPRSFDRPRNDEGSDQRGEKKRFFDKDGNVFFKHEFKQKRQDLATLYDQYLKTNFSVGLSTIQRDIVRYIDLQYIKSDKKTSFVYKKDLLAALSQYDTVTLQSQLDFLEEKKILQLVSDYKDGLPKYRLSIDIVIPSKSNR